MREIKFKVWDTIEKRMDELACIHFDSGLLSTKRDPSTFSPIRYYKLRQYTGLKDKNGKEIYEGDIVTAWIIERFGNYNIPDDLIGRIMEEQEWSGEIVYKGGQFVINDGEDTPLSTWAENTDKDFNIEIIGNIYENPELLKKDGEPK